MGEFFGNLGHPLFFQTKKKCLGVFIYYVLSRYAHAIPYTAIVFICGMFIGLAAGNENSPMNACESANNTMR